LRKQWHIIAVRRISSALTSISRQSEYIISRRLYTLSQWWYTTLRVGDIQFLAKLMIYKAHALILILQWRKFFRYMASECIDKV
jgi:hypothetical protein